MMFPSLDRAIGYLVGQNPGKVIILSPIKWEDGGTTYNLRFHSPNDVKVRGSFAGWTRAIRLDLTSKGEWDIKISKGG